MASGSFMDAATVTAMRESLTELFGLEGGLWQQYFGFLKRVIVTGDFGPSMAMYPTPVNTLISQALPWTIGLLVVSAIIAWLLGNVIGLIAGYKRDKKYAKLLELLAITVHPLPYYILALVLIILFAYKVPIFPMTTYIKGKPFTLEFIKSVVYNSVLPAFSIIIASAGWWVISMKALASDVAEEDFVRFARLKKVKETRIIGSYIARNAILPQITALALTIGGVFSGSLITEVIFGYPGLGSLTYSAVLQADYNLLMGTVVLAIIAVATAALIIDLLYPMLDPRIRHK